MRQRIIIAGLWGTFLALALGACGQAIPTTPSDTNSSRSVIPRKVVEQTLTLNPDISPRASVQQPTFTRGTPFVPLDQPAFLDAAESGFLPDEDLVLGLEWMGESRAYPIRMITYHHIVNDTVAGRPVLVTY